MARTSLVPQQPVFLSEADNKQLAEMDRQREAFNAAVEKYNQGVMGPGGYNEQLNAYIARLKEIEASGEEVPLPTAPTKMDVPVAPFTEESFVQAQEAAQARAQEAAGQRALAIQAFEDPSRFNLAGFAGLGSRTFAKGGEVKEEGTKASRMMKELGLSKPPKEKTLADEPSKQTPESLAYSLRAQAEGNRDKDLRKESFSAPGALNVKRFEAGGEARSGEGFSPIAGSMGMPGAPEHERMRADTLGFIKRMDDASVMATASRMTGMPFDTPTQARLMLEQLLGGGVSVSAGVMGIGQGMPERVVGYDVGAKFPALGGQMSVGATVPRGAGKPSFNVGYRKEFKDGGEVTTNDAFIAKHQAGGPVSKGRRPVREASPRAPQLDSEYTFGSEDAFEFTPAGTRNRLMRLVRSSVPPGSSSKLFSDPQITRSREEFDQLARASKQPPLPSDAVGMFDAFVGPRGAMYVSPLGGSATLTHEAAHAADYNLKGLYRQAIESKERKSNPAAQQFVDAYEKLVGGKEYFGSQESRKKGAETFDAKWVEENKDYRSHTPELAAFAMENAMGGDRGQLTLQRGPLHLDPTLATEFTILTDLAQKYVDSRTNKPR